MKTTNLAFRIAAVSISAILLSGFVAYRAGALNSIISSTDEPLPVDSPVTQVDSTAVLPLMPGSKSDLMFELEKASAGEYPDSVREQLEKEAEMMRSSKSLTPVVRPSDLDIIAPSSKSAPVFTPADTSKPR